MHPEAEIRQDGPFLVCLRHAPISPSAPLYCEVSPLRASHASLGLASVEDHGDALIRHEALAQLPAEFHPIAADHDEPWAQPLSA
jgi:hypothetical protein